ncbi:MAG: Flp pilus assembly complex ATPase component TadA [Actinomycetales bacterium]|nr:Flp pilus assembly complex ATPase component TadA [Actinomycetales bacterium]
MSGVVARDELAGELTAELGDSLVNLQTDINQNLASDVFALPTSSATPDLAEISDSGAFGPLTEFMSDPTIEEIWINSPSKIFVARNGVSELTTLFLSADTIRTLVERLLSTTGRRVDLSQPFVDAMLPDGSRLHVVIPEITREFWTINIRKFVTRPQNIMDLVAQRSLTNQAAQFLQLCVDSNLNVIISGATGAGKTTFINALLNSAQAIDRIVTCEEVFELQLVNPDWVALQTRQPSLEDTGEISLRRIIKEALRMRPSRLVIGEVRQAECLDLLVAMNSGMPSMCSIHANGAREAVAKLCLLPMLAGNNVSAEFVVPSVAASIDLIVHLDRDASGLRSVREIAALSGRVEGGNIELTPIFARKNDQLLPSDFYELMTTNLQTHKRLKFSPGGESR